MECYRIFTSNTFEQWPQSMFFWAMVLAFVFIVGLNTFLMVALIKTNPKQLTVTTKLFIYLTFWDLVIGLVTIPTQLVSIIIGESSSCLLIGLQAFLNAFSPQQSMSTIFTLSLFRYITITKPLTRIGVKHLYTALTVNFVMSIAISLWYLKNSMVQEIDKEMGYFLITITAYVLLVIGGSIILNMSLYYKLMKRWKESLVIGINQSTERHKHANVTMILLTVILIICYVPNGISFSVFGYRIITNAKQSYRSYTPLAHFIMLSNAGFNSLTYILRTRKIRQYLRKLLLGTNSDTNQYIATHIPEANPIFYLNCRLVKFSAIQELSL